MLFFEKNSNNKATVAVTVKKAASTPTDAPSTSPSDTPSTAPSDTPSDTPTDTPTTAPGALGKITELKATKSTQLTATFDSAVPADTKIEVTKGNTSIEGKSTIDGSTVVFDATANLTAGTYTLTATLGDVKVSADTEVKDSYVAEIKITSKEALTGETTSGSAITSKEAYIYYDVVNQYGESIRNSTTINWTTSVGNESKKINKALGKITVSGEAASLNYGSLIYVTGVHVGSGVSVSTSVPVGMAQAVDTIEFAGFINTDSSTKLVDSLPINFPNNKYLLAYRTFDQNGNPLEVTGTEVKDSKLTFISDNVLLIDPSSFKDAEKGTYTIDGVEYSAVTINPGEYVGKGGEVNITAIANKTGQKTVKNFVVGSAGLLQSLSLDTPAGVVADGDQWVKLPYTAKDVDGKNITNYETIVRSSNTLNLTSTDGTLYVIEENDGTAGIYWSDDATKATVFDDSSEDGVDRSVSLGTMVIGGDSNMMILPVSDARRPVAFKSIKLNPDDNNAIVNGNEATIKFYGSNDVVYLDQYGGELKGDDQKSIIENYLKKSVRGNKHGIKVKTDGNGKILGGTNSAALPNGMIFDGSTGKTSITLNANLGTVTDKTTALSSTFKFSIVTTADKNSTSDVNAWDNVDNEKSIAYTVVPLHKLTGFGISKVGKQEITTNNSENANFAASGSAITAKAEGTLKVVSSNITPTSDIPSNAFNVTGEYDGKTITIPSTAYAVASGSAFTIDGNKLDAVVDGELKWSDLYDENTARLTRRDAIIDLKLEIIDPLLDGGKEPLSLKVTVSDAKGVPTDVRFFKGWSEYDPKDVTLLPEATEIKAITYTGDNKVANYKYGPWDAILAIGMWTDCQVHVFDQYGKVVTGIGLTPWGEETKGVDVGEFIEYTVSEIKENEGDFAHLTKSFKVAQNGSTYKKLKITGAELGDTYTLTATIPGTTISKSVKVTVGADTKAFVSKGKVNSDSDEAFRKEKLNYKK